MKGFNLLIISFLFCLSYNFANAQNERSFTVVGEIDTVAHATYYITYRENDVLLEDTIQLDAQSRFVLHGKADEPVLIYMSILKEKRSLGTRL